jgi:ketosteroid isomerase-like protein
MNIAWSTRFTVIGLNFYKHDFTILDRKSNAIMTTQSANTLTVAQQAFTHFEHGLATGDWQAFLDMLTDDFSFWFPIGQFHGLNVGKDRAIAFLQYVSEVYSDGITLTLDRVTSNETTVVFEFRDQGLMWGEPYKNRVAVSFDVRGDKICGYREYLGSDGKSN